jgi:hypothetical protein
VHLVKLVGRVGKELVGLRDGARIESLEAAKDWISDASEVLSAVNPALDAYCWWGTAFLLEKGICRVFKQLAAEKQVLNRAAASCLANALADLKESCAVGTGSDADGLRDVVQFLQIIEEEEDGERAKQLIGEKKGSGLNVLDGEIKWLLAVFTL